MNIEKTIEITGKMFKEKHKIKMNRFFISENEFGQKTLGYLCVNDKDKIGTEAIRNIGYLMKDKKKFPNITITRMDIGKGKYLAMVIFLGSYGKGEKTKERKETAEAKKELKEAMKEFDEKMDYEKKKSNILGLE